MSAPEPITRNSMTQLKERFSELLSKLFGRHDQPRHRQAAKKIDTTVQIPFDLYDNKMEKEQLRMKAITLLQKDKTLLPLLPELLAAPIQVKINEEKGQKWVICLSQQFEKDGQKLTLEGRFIRTTKSSHSIPIPESFKIVPNDENK